MRFQHHVQHQFLFHKQSIKLAKKKQYKNPIGNSQTVRKFTIPKEYEKDFYVRQKSRLNERKKQAEAQAKPKDVKIGDIISGSKTSAAQEAASADNLRELNLPGGKTTAQAT